MCLTEGGRKALVETIPLSRLEANYIKLAKSLIARLQREGRENERVIDRESENENERIRLIEREIEKERERERKV